MPGKQHEISLVFFNCFQQVMHRQASLGLPHQSGEARSRDKKEQSDGLTLVEQQSCEEDKGGGGKTRNSKYQCL